MPDATGTLTATVAYALTRTDGVVPDAIYDQHFEVIRARHRLAAQSHDGARVLRPAGGDLLHRRFNAGVNAAAVERNKGVLRAKLRAEPRAFV